MWCEKRPRGRLSNKCQGHGQCQTQSFETMSAQKTQRHLWNVCLRKQSLSQLMLKPEEVNCIWKHF